MKRLTSPIRYEFTAEEMQQLRATLSKGLSESDARAYVREALKMVGIEPSTVEKEKK